MTCIFCSKQKIDSDTLHETEHFRVIIGLGIATAGHVMIIPKEHLDCFAEIPKEWYDEYFALREKLIALQKQHFSEPFCVEYGVWGQTVFHAHVHFIPHKGENLLISDVMKEVNPPDVEFQLPFSKIEFRDLKKVYDEEQGYVYFSQDGKEYVVHARRLTETYKEIDSHLKQRIGYRHFVHKQNDCPESWKKITEEEKKKDDLLRQITREKLKF